MIGVLLFVMANILGRQFGFYIRGADAYAGYSMAASSFLALAYALGHGDHIRVTLVLQHVGQRLRHGFEIWCLAAACFLTGVFGFYSVKMVWWSYTFHDISQSNDATPLWIPQLGMAIGVSVMFVAFVEKLVIALRGGAVGAEDVAVSEQHFE